MGLGNCTINSSSVEVTPSQALGSGVSNQVLTITPNQVLELQPLISQTTLVLYRLQ